jgi:cytochrome P450
MLMVFHPEGIGHVLHDRHAIYHKDNPDYRMLRPILSDGLVTANGDVWRRQRRLMQPAFRREPLDDRAVVPEPLVTLRPCEGLPLRLRLW